MKHRLTFEVRAEEDSTTGGSTVACRASFPHLSLEVERLEDPTRLDGPSETIRLVVNPHVKLGQRHPTHDFSLEGDLDTMEKIGQELTKAAREYRQIIRKKAGGA